VLLTTETLIVLAVGHFRIVSIPLELGTYPVTASGEPLKSSMILSVARSPVQVMVTVLAAAPEAIALVPRDCEPLQTVIVVPVLGKQVEPSEFVHWRLLA